MCDVRRVVGLVAALAFAPYVIASSASDTIGYFGIIEKVVFEPNAESPERIQLWGAFAYANVSPELATASQARRGYLYFRLPPSTSAATAATIRTEWRDLASLAGTGQAAGFGRWGYVGSFPTDPAAQRRLWMGLVEGGDAMDLRVRVESETPAGPAVYATNIGIVKLSANGSHKQVVAALKAALGR